MAKSSSSSCFDRSKSCEGSEASLRVLSCATWRSPNPVSLPPIMFPRHNGTRYGKTHKESAVEQALANGCSYVEAADRVRMGRKPVERAVGRFEATVGVESESSGSSVDEKDGLVLADHRRVGRAGSDLLASTGNSFEGSQKDEDEMEKGDGFYKEEGDGGRDSLSALGRSRIPPTTPPAPNRRPIVRKDENRLSSRPSSGRGGSWGRGRRKGSARGESSQS